MLSVYVLATQFYGARNKNRSSKLRDTKLDKQQHLKHKKQQLLWIRKSLSLKHKSGWQHFVDNELAIILLIKRPLPDLQGFGFCAYGVSFEHPNPLARVLYELRRRAISVPLGEPASICSWPHSVTVALCILHQARPDVRQTLNYSHCAIHTHIHIYIYIYMNMCIYVYMYTQDHTGKYTSCACLYTSALDLIQSQ